MAKALFVQLLNQKSTADLISLSKEIHQESFDTNSPMRKFVEEAFGKFELLHVLAVGAATAYILALRLEKRMEQESNFKSIILNLEDVFESVTHNMSDATIIRPRRMPKMLSKTEILIIFDDTFKEK